MYYLSQPMPRNPRGCLGDVLNFHPLALKNLMPSLVHAYVREYWSFYVLRSFALTARH